MKKIILFLSIFLIAGCSKYSSNTLTIDSAISTILSEEATTTNTNGQGFKYYKPRDFSLLEDNLYNHILMNNSIKYYLNIDINNYYNKVKTDYKENSSLYFSKKFYYNDKSGYLEIRSGNNNYFYIKMMYNYSNIEVSVKESDIKESVMNSLIILSSIRYNDSVISKLISSGDLNTKESQYELKKPHKEDDNKNILDFKQDYSGYEE